MQTESIGQILVRDTDLTAEQLDQALREQQTRRPRCNLGQILVEKGYVSAASLGRVLAKQWEIPFVESIRDSQLDAELLRELNLGFMKKHRMLPIRDEQGRIVIAMQDPLDVMAYDGLMNVLGRYCERAMSTAEEIERAISHCYYQLSDHSADEKGDDSAGESKDSAAAVSHGREDLLDIANQAPVIRQVNTILFQAVQGRASDIHMEPYEQDVKVRFRIDGVLHDVLSWPKGQLAALVSRVKIMANLNIAERRLPQDGQSRIRIGEKELDIRVSTIPTSYGERVVLRLLDKGCANLSLAELGFDGGMEKQFRAQIHQPHGIVLLTGPTGSGKTTTLYGAIQELNGRDRNILTVEDPIEYQLPGVGQMQVKPKINLTFANCLRHILRQDPDVIMIGEIRDGETAEIAIHASLTGHLVLSTLHTNDSASAMTRLMDMSIEPYLISSSLTAVIAQRLVRVICPSCRTECRVEGDLSRTLGEDYDAVRMGNVFYTGTGCASCMQTGYMGRTGIFELLAVDEKIKDMINKRMPAHAIKEYAVEEGMRTLRQHGLQKVFAGVTTMEEVLRITHGGAGNVEAMSYDVAD